MGDTTNNPSRAATAHHEAGHAVVGYRLGGYSMRVTIARGETENEAGHALVQGHDDEGRVLVLYAGRAAESRFLGFEVSEGFWADYAVADQILPFLTETREQMQRRAAELVEQNWPAIQTLAEALLERETLDSDEADVVIGCLDDDVDWREGLAQYRALRNLKEF